MSGFPVRWTEERIIAALQADGAPRLLEWDTAGHSPSTGTIRNRFGTWNKALEAAGLPTRPPGRPTISRNGNSGKGACVRGHPFDEKNTAIRSDGDRRCRRCDRERKRAKRAGRP